MAGKARAAGSVATIREAEVMPVLIAMVNQCLSFRMNISEEWQPSRSLKDLSQKTHSSLLMQQKVLRRSELNKKDFAKRH